MKLFVFGLGYAARAIVDLVAPQFTAMAATTRAPSASDAAGRVRLHAFDGETLGEPARADLAAATHLLVSIPPDHAGDPVLRACASAVEAAGSRAWIGYLSSVAVYGDRAGGWVDEDGALDAASPRGRWRIAAEEAWRDVGRRVGAPVHVFRLAGVYGPGRNALANLRAGKAKRLVKPGQVFNRIHVDDIARIAAATIAQPHRGGVWNLADDEPAPPQDVIACAAVLLGVAPLPEIAFDADLLSPMAASFWADNKRVANRRVKDAFALALRHPTYREGLRALAAAGEGK